MPNVRPAWSVTAVGTLLQMPERTKDDVTNIPLMLLQLRTAIIDGEAVPPWPVVRRPYPTHLCAFLAARFNPGRIPTHKDQGNETLLTLEVEIVTQRIQDKVAALRKLDAALQARIRHNRARARQLEAAARLDRQLARQIERLLRDAEFVPVANKSAGKGART